MQLEQAKSRAKAVNEAHDATADDDVECEKQSFKTDPVDHSRLGLASCGSCPTQNPVRGVV